MFTGIITTLGKFVAFKKEKNPCLIIEVETLKRPVNIGDSLAVNGACLTVVDIKDGQLSFNLSEKTLSLSMFADLYKGEFVNLEQPLALQDLLHGHLVSGHLDGVARVKRIQQKSGSTAFTFVYKNRDWSRFIIRKGSISVNGISLTISENGSADFSVEVIPHTLGNSNLKNLKIKQRVNIELDLIAKYLYNLTFLKRVK